MLKFVVSGFGIAFSIVLFFLINLRIIENNKDQISHEIEKVALLIEQKINRIDLVLSSMSSYLRDHQYITKKEFIEFTQPYINNLKGIKALEWVPKIQYSDRESFEYNNRKLYQNKFEITHKNAEEKLVRSPVEDYYFPVLYAHPLLDNEDAIGFDLYSDSTRRLAIKESIIKNSITLTPPVKLVQVEDETYGILAVRPVVRNDSVKGLSLGVYNIDTFIREIFNNQPFNFFDLIIYDENENYKPLFSNNLNYEGFSVFYGPGSIQKKLRVYNRNWISVFTPQEKHTSFPHAQLSYLILVTGLLSSYLLFILIRNNERHQLELVETVDLKTKALINTLKQKEILLKEIHHRVKNSLQLVSSIIRLQRHGLTDENATRVLDASERRIYSVSLVHRLLYQNKEIEYIRLDDYLHELATHNLDVSGISITITCPEIKVHIDIATPLSLMINECISNSIKHAFTDDSEGNEINVEIELLKHEMLQVTISDNGKGFPDHFDPFKTTEGLGMELVTLLSQQIEADFKFLNTESGSSVIFLLKNQT